MQIVLFSLAVILFIGLILVHEWGHFIVARRNGVEVEEFGLGFPPRALKKKLKSGMVLSLNWLPLGGFVKLRGESDSDKRKHSFGAASVRVKTKILLAGVGMNLMVGLVILTALAWIGMPKIITQANVGQDQFTVASDTRIIRQDVRVGYIIPGSPADSAGLRSTDLLKSISSGSQNFKLNTAAQVRDATQTFAGQKILVTYERNGRTFAKDVQLLNTQTVQASQKTDNPKGYLGIVPTYIQVQRSTWSAPVVAAGFTKQLVELTFKGLGQALGGLGSIIAGGVTGNHQARVNGQTQATEQVGGPVAIGSALWGSGSLGFSFVLWLIAVISLTLALINALPIPALDGGRVLLIWISRGLFRRPLSKLMEERLVGASMALLLGLMALITVVDVKRFL